MTHRSYDRKETEMRPLSFQLGVMPYAEGSALVTAGCTRVICTATADTCLPKWLENKNQGWITAEYGMLPRSTQTRMTRERVMTNGRTQEIQRLIGRSLRSVCDLKLIEPYRITLDCDVLQADGGTRTASISGAWLALAQALIKMRNEGKISQWPLKDSVAAISVGLVNNVISCDLDYKEDSSAQVDANFVMTGSGKLVEVQATAEGRCFDPAELTQMMQYAGNAIKKITALQYSALEEADLVIPS